MLPEIQGYFERIEHQRAEIQRCVLELPEAALAWSPNANAWSIRQIVEHLVLSDETLGRAKPAGKVESEALMYRVLPRSWRREMISRALRRDTALPLPSPAVEPAGKTLLSELLARWEQVRSEMYRALDTMDGLERRYSHPVIGPMTALQMLELEEIHTAYHTRQIEALQRDPVFLLHQA